jgi:hypothetical protein
MAYVIGQIQAELKLGLTYQRKFPRSSSVKGQQKKRAVVGVMGCNNQETGDHLIDAISQLPRRADNYRTQYGVTTPCETID